MLESLRSVVVSDDDSVTVTMNDDANTTLVFPNFDEVHEFIRQLSDAVDVDRESDAYIEAHHEDRAAYMSALDTFVDAALALDRAYVTEHFNADDEFSNASAYMSKLITCSFDEWVLELMNYRDLVIDR